ncbi:MAG: hypothetical protein IMZ64_07470 [Bacteroidetes bacterium]|nr:hypothetical protein [Bacteroidota bacterium]
MSKEIIGEIFDDEFMPEGVMLSTPQFIGTLSGEARAESRMRRKNYIFKLRRPTGDDFKRAMELGVPFPFTWIQKGDYVVTYPNGYVTVEPANFFKSHYLEVEEI